MPCKIKIVVFFILFKISPFQVTAQDQQVADSLSVVYHQNNLTGAKKLEVLTDLSFNEIKDLKKAADYADELIGLSKQINSKSYLRMGYYLKGDKSRLQGNFQQALSAFFISAELAVELHDMKAEGESYGAIADVYSNTGNHTTATQYYGKAIKVLRTAKNVSSLASILLNAGDEYLKAKKYDTALLYDKEASVIFDTIKYETGKAYSLGNTGMVYAAMGNNNLAEKKLNEAIQLLEANEDYNAVCDYLLSMATLYQDRHQVSTAIGYAAASLQHAKQYGIREQAANASLKLSGLYEETGNGQEALLLYKQHIALKDSLHNIQTVQQMADLRTTYEVSQKQKEVDVIALQKKNQKKVSILLAAVLCMALFISLILLINNRHRKKAYGILNLQKQATEEQRTKAETALKELQAAQKQLIYSAKMASLGEVTAGIAHEIQNPLNFVNNFSEINIELIDELKGLLSNKLSVPDKELVDELINSVESNLIKINDHGTRADGIVKGMLQHSRGTSGIKELTAINPLVEEALRLSYHGLRARNKEFNVLFQTDFDKHVGKAAVVAPEILRVLLNLCNNAFYAVALKKKTAGTSFEPLVLVTTRKTGDKIIISVKDNGNGIPQKNIEKIFQPFFTTKPTGEGTGLGLSLSYEIIKIHNGELKVETEEGVFSEFIIELPLRE